MDDMHVVSSSAALLLASPAFFPHWKNYPKTYQAKRATRAIELDGDLTKDVWSMAPWSDDFDDIRGPDDAPADERPTTACRTRFKMLWDDTYLYIGAEIMSDFGTMATFTKRNAPIFQLDSDFEVFIDPGGTCHSYKELELNALNTVWNLMLNRPYDDGGSEYSGRIAQPGEESYYDVKGQKTATRILEGSLNDPGTPTKWSIEIAMAHSDTLSHLDPSHFKPEVGARWRINFSRVEDKGEINWTWQPQIVWDPMNRRYSGRVAMHLPDAWGYVEFTNKEIDSSSDNIEGNRDLTWPARLAVMNIYYAQHTYFNQHDEFCQNLEDLQELIDNEIVDPFDVMIVSRGQGGFIATVTNDILGLSASVTDDRFVSVGSRNILESDKI